MRIETMGVHQIRPDHIEAVELLTELNNRREPQHIQVCTLADDSMVGLAAYRTILDGDATELVGIRINLNHYMAGLGSVMLRAFAEEQQQQETVIVGAIKRIDINPLFQHACDGRVYPNFTSTFLRSDYVELLDVAERYKVEFQTNQAEHPVEPLAGKIKRKRLFVSL